MFQKQPFFDESPCVLDLLALRRDHRTIAHLCIAGGNQFRPHRDLARRVPCADFHQAHAATSHNRQSGMPAVVRNLHASPSGRLNRIETLVAANLDFNSVYDDRGHGC